MALTTGVNLVWRFVVLPSTVLACSVLVQLTILAERREAVTKLVYFKATHFPIQSHNLLSAIQGSGAVSVL
jgi:hypothetical protein